MKIVKQLSSVGTSLLVSASLLGVQDPEEENSTERNQVQEAPVVLSKETSLQETAVVSTTKEKTITPTAKEGEPSREQRLLYFKNYGWMATQQSGMQNLGDFSKKGKEYTDLEEEKEAYIEGVRAALEGKECPGKLGEIMKPMQEYFQKRSAEYAKELQEVLKVVAEKNRKAGSDYIEDLKKKDPSIKTTSTGLHYIISNEGDKKCMPTEEDRVEITYKGSFIDGTIFDKSEEGKPIDFFLNGVIPAIREGLLMVGEGGEIKLFCPDSLAYGENNIPGIPAGSFLIFDIKLNKVHKTMNEASGTESSKDKLEDKTNKEEELKISHQEEGIIDKELENKSRKELSK